MFVEKTKNNSCSQMIKLFLFFYFFCHFTIRIINGFDKINFYMKPNSGLLILEYIKNIFINGYVLF